MTDKAPTPGQHMAARMLLVKSREYLFDIVKLIKESKQEFEADGETLEQSFISLMLEASAMAVSEKLTSYLHEGFITIDQAEFLKNQLNDYYNYIIKENIEND